jgi:hypothetical protein
MRKSLKARSPSICFPPHTVPAKVKPLSSCSLGLTPDRWEALALALKQHASGNEVALEEKTIFGTRYIIDGLLKAPDGRLLNIRAAWYINTGGDVPRFVTAHPLRRRRS